MKQLRPNVPLGFTSYPTKGQAVAQGVPWDALLAQCDFGAPQVYWPYQGKQLADETVYHDHHGKPTRVAFAPADWSAWEPAAKSARAHDGGVSIWAAPIDPQLWPSIRALRSGEATIAVTATLVELDLRDAPVHPVEHRLVNNLKALLKATGDTTVDPGRIDGKATSMTLEAVHAYQQARGLRVDGIVGVNTWRNSISG